MQHYKVGFAKKFVTKVSFLFSTCVDEALLCRGIPLCENKNDLKACKMNLPNMDWIEIDSFPTCKPVDHPDYIMPYGQKINSKLISDDDQFYCLNRGDKNPFLVTNSESNETDDDSKTWIQWVNTPCENWYDRRCLGLRPDKCVDSVRKYICLKIKTIPGITVNANLIWIHTTTNSKFISTIISKIAPPEYSSKLFSDIQCVSLYQGISLLHLF